MRRLLSLGLVAAACAWPLCASADAYGDLQKAAAAFNAQKSYHADEHFSNGLVVAVDYITPDRLKVIPSSGGGEIVIGDDFWVNDKRRWTKLPSFAARLVTGKVDQYRHTLQQAVDRGSVKDLGMQNVAGKTLHAYSFVARGTPVTMWLDAKGLPAQQVTTSGSLTTTIVYSYGNVSIEAP